MFTALGMNVEVEIEREMKELREVNSFPAIEIKSGKDHEEDV